MSKHRDRAVKTSHAQYPWPLRAQASPPTDSEITYVLKRCDFAENDRIDAGDELQTAVPQVV